jgi:hypothetical protein
MLLHQDASRFAWLPGDDRQYDLVVTLDDATGAMYSGFLVAEEGTASSFRGLLEVVEKHGLFCELYTDRGSHYFHTPKAGEPVSKRIQTQVGRALAQLGIGHIAAYSPEARGRSERAFRTLQDRLPKELRLAGITTLEAANRWIAHLYPGLQRRVCRRCRAGRHGFCARSGGRRAGYSVHPGGAPWRQRQHRQMARAAVADPAQSAAAALCPRRSSGPRISRRHARTVSRAASPGRLRCRRRARQTHELGRMTRFHAAKFDPQGHAPGDQIKNEADN